MVSYLDTVLAEHFSTNLDQLSFTSHKLKNGVVSDTVSIGVYSSLELKPYNHSFRRTLESRPEALKLRGLEHQGFNCIFHIRIPYRFELTQTVSLPSYVEDF